MKKAYKTTTKKILEDAEKEMDSPEENAPLKDWIAYALKKYDEMMREEESKNIKEEYLINKLITELFFTFEERGLNKLINSIDNKKEREEQIHLDYGLTFEQAEIIGKLISRNFSPKEKDILLETLIHAKNTRKPPLSPYRKPNKKMCPNCDSTRFKLIQREFMNEKDISKKVCLKCGYIHKITKKELEPKFIGD